MIRLSSQDRRSLIRLASSLPKGDESRRVILSGLRRTARVEFHVEYVSNSTLRLMVSDRTSSTYFEARVGPNASVELSEKAAQAGFRISSEIIEEEIEQK